MTDKEQKIFAETLEEGLCLYTEQDMWKAFLSGQRNMDNDGCQIDEEDAAFEEFIDEIKNK